MNKNMGMVDRVLRVTAAVVFAILYFTGTVTGFWGIVLLVFAVIFVVTSVVSFCPLYVPFKFNTKKE